MKENYLPKDAASYPLCTATRTAMVEIAEKYVKEYESALEALCTENKLQKKALNIQKHMAQHCAMFAAIAYNRDTWQEQIEVRERVLTQLGILQKYEDGLASLSPDAQGAFILYVYANAMLNNAFIGKHAANAQKAMANGTPEKSFDDRIMLGTIYTVCREWRAWWKEHGTLPCDEWTYEDAPYDTEEGAQ